MTERLWIRSHVERLLQEIWDTPTVVQDADGDYRWVAGTAAAWVGLTPAELPCVKVEAQAVVGVKRTAALLRELNDFQCRTPVVLHWCHGAVAVSDTISPFGLTATSLRASMDLVERGASELGSMIRAVHGGSLPFPSDDSQPDREVG